MEIRNGYAVFWGSWPSNWEPSTFIIDKVRYNCVEQYMMAEKARLFGDEEVRAKILASPYPKAQKAFGRKVRGYNDAAWSAVRYSIVLAGTLEKYKQNAELRALLLDTGDAVFVEASPSDAIWGIGLPEDSPDATNPSKWRGQNLLGKAITEVRGLIRHAEEDDDNDAEEG
jgi:ribA/ribD-fused uncharacterized protein